MVIILLLGTGITTIWLDTEGTTSQKENMSHSETISAYDSTDDVVNEYVDSSEIFYESSVEIWDEETFKEEIEKDAQNGEKALDTDEEEKMNKLGKNINSKICVTYSGSKSVMKKKKILKMLCIVFIAIGSIVIKANSVKAMPKEDYRRDGFEVGNKENEYSESDLNEIISVLPDSEKLYLGEEMQCYNVNNNEVMTYIPIYNGEECAYVANCEKNGKLSISSDSDFVEKIHNKFDNDQNVLLYINGSKFFAESKNKCCLIEEYPIEQKQNKRFNKFNWDKKVNYMRAEIDNNNQNTYSTSIVVASQSLSAVSDLDLVKCNISNFVKQEYNNCWAASVATIVNYKKSKNLTAGDVSKAMRMSWYLGGDVFNVRDALKHYGLSYTIKLGNHISWAKVKSDINRNRPFCIGFECPDNSHMVTGYGYAEAKKNKYIALWDSNGHQRLLTYDGSDTQITMYGFTYRWKDTVY